MPAAQRGRSPRAASQQLRVHEITDFLVRHPLAPRTYSWPSITSGAPVSDFSASGAAVRRRVLRLAGRWERLAVAILAVPVLAVAAREDLVQPELQPNEVAEDRAIVHRRRARTCSNCGSQLSATAKFCLECAHPVPRGTPPRLLHALDPDVHGLARGGLGRSHKCECAYIVCTVYCMLSRAVSE
jgi:hypothetical protein